jgi:hypothetical protein
MFKRFYPILERWEMWFTSDTDEQVTQIPSTFKSGAGILEGDLSRCPLLGGGLQRPEGRLLAARLAL